jgi:hypothetical protein
MKLEEWVRTKKMQAQTNLYIDCIKFSTGPVLRQNRLITCMNKTFHEHAIKIVTANMHRSLEFAVVDVVNDQNVPTGLYSVQVQDMSSIQKDFFGPVQWVNNFLDRNPDFDEASTSDINRMDRAVSVHDFFPLFRNRYLSDGESCSCQYPKMQGLPCEHCFAVMLLKKQTKLMPDVFLNNQCWHIESDETESQFQLWCLQLLSRRELAPQPKIPNSTARSRYNGLMLTAKTMISGYSLSVKDTAWLEDQMTQMCLDLKDRHATNQNTVDTLTSASGLRHCSVCQLPGHRCDSAIKCTKHKDFVPSPVEAQTLNFHGKPLQIGSLPPARHPGGATPVTVVQLGAPSDAIVPQSAATGSVQSSPPQSNGEPHAMVVQPVADAPHAQRLFNASAQLDAIREEYDAFDARLCLSNLYPRPVPGNGDCFWMSCVLAMKWLAKRNTTWATATRIPATAMAMRQKVLDFMQTNLQTDWALQGLNVMTTFETAIRDEIPFGVLCGSTGVLYRPASIPDWFEASRKEFTYTSLCCVQATALCFRLVIKIFVQGSMSVEQHVTRDSLLQAPEDAAIVNPDVCVCLCKRDRAGHFDPCEWVPPKVYVQNPETRKGRGKAKQARYKSAIEMSNKKPKEKK